MANYFWENHFTEVNKFFGTCKLAELIPVSSNVQEIEQKNELTNLLPFRPESHSWTVFNNFF